MPGLGKRSVGECLVAGPFTMGYSWAQPKRDTWVHHVGLQPAGGAIEVQGYMGGVEVKRQGLGGPIPICLSPLLEQGRLRMNEINLKMEW